MRKYSHLSLEEREKIYAWKLQGVSLREIGRRFLIFLYVRKHLRKKWSPETIEGRLPIDYPGYSITDETINHAIKINLNMDVYFCHAYRSWEKGTVENTIGRLRRYLPKGVSLDNISDEKIQEIEKEMNNTPRKCLGFLTPYEKLEQLLKGKGV